MSKKKLDLSIASNNESVKSLTKFLNTYPDTASKTMSYVPTRELSRLPTLSKDLNKFFQSDLDKRTAVLHVVEGNVRSLKRIIGNDPSWLYAIYPEVSAPGGQKYFDVSIFQLITFLCDDDMKTQIMGLKRVVEFLKDNDKWQKIREQQYEKIACGGSDLIKLDRAPEIVIAEHGFKGLMHYKQTFTFYDKTQHEAIFPLLENPDGIVCYQDEEKEKHFYYVNQKDETIEALDKCIIPEEHKEEFEQFKVSFDAMENNSSRRSSEKEHQFIKKIFNCSLVQNGILYQYNDVLYRDSRAPFHHLINAYRTRIRLYEEVNAWPLRANVDRYWREHIGGAQAQASIWVLQRFCEKNKPFHPFSTNHLDTFTRCLDFDNGVSRKDNSLLVAGFILDGLGADFGEYD